jgi:hypothetical protein
MSRATPPSSQPSAQPQTNSSKLPHDKIAMRAYEKWCKRGKPVGSNPEQDWLEAERELMQEHGRGQAMPQTPGPQRR